MFSTSRTAVVVLTVLVLLVGLGLALTSTPAPPLAGAAPQATPTTDPGTWMKTYGGSRDTHGGGILLADDGGYFIVGTTNVQFEPVQEGDIYLIRTDADGEILWEKTYGGEGLQNGSGITWTSDGNLLIVGFMTSAETAGIDAYILKVDQEGNEIWFKTYGGPLDEMVGGIAQTPDGEYILGGVIVDPNDIVADPGAAGYGGMAGRSNLYLFGIDADGNELWSKRFDSEDNVLSASAARTPDGGFLLLANITYFPDPDNDMLLLKVDADGNEIWSRVWDEGKITARDITSTSDGNYLISAAYVPPDSPVDSKEDFLFIKVDPDGNEIWRSTFGDPDLIDYGFVVAEAPDGGFVAVSERTPDHYTREADISLVKIDANGQLVWERHAPATHTMLTTIIRHPDGGYLIGGAMFRDPVFNIILIRADAEGHYER